MASHSDSLVILIPNFNDWEPLQLLLNQLDPVAGTLPWRVSVLIVDDASTLPMPPGWPSSAPGSLSPVPVLPFPQLAHNQPHAALTPDRRGRAAAVGEIGSG